MKASFLTPLLDGGPAGYRLLNERTGLSVAHRIQTAFDSSSRRTGLLRHTSLPEGAALVIAPTNAIQPLRHGGLRPPSARTPLSSCRPAR
jgi:hypothetical protein